MPEPDSPATTRADRTWLRHLRGWTDGERLQRHEETMLLVLTLLIGAVVGLAVAAFIVVTERLSAFLLPSGAAGWRRVGVPAAGALVAGALLYRYFPNARGSGIPQTKTALALHRGHIPLSTALGKFVCSSLSLGSGIALGREGPTVQIGAGIASVLGRRLGLGPRRVQSLIPVGTSAAVAAAFNTPISAILFTLEEIVGDLHAPVLGSVVISSATSWAVLRLVLGDEPLFHVPAYQLVHPLELGVYAVLGGAGGLVSAAFVRLLLGLRARFRRWPASTMWWQPAVGGLAIGVLGWFVPSVLGVGYNHVGDALNGRMLLGGMALLLALKLVATATAYASGNAGGIFGPSLFIGAMLGGTLGSAAHAWMPDVTGSPGAYALVGMGTAFAGIIRAPMTSVIMIFEITRDYSIIVPVMIANLLSYLISARLQPVPVYEALLQQDGVELPPSRTRTGGPTAEQAMTESVLRLSAHETLGAAGARVSDQGSGTGGAWPVVDGNRFLGMLTRRQLDAAAGRGGEPLGRILGPPSYPLTADRFPHVHPDQSLDIVLQRMGQAGLHVMPVVSRRDVQELLGTVALSDLPTVCMGEDEQESPSESDHRERPSPRALLTVVITGVLGIFLVGGLLANHYYSARLERARLSYEAGMALVRQGRDTDAAEAFRSALSLTHDQQYRLALGLALSRSGRNPEATVYLDEVLRNEPANGPANLAMARGARARRDTATAITYYDRAIAGEWPPQDQGQANDATFELVDWLMAAGNRRQAVAELLRLASRTGDPGVQTKAGLGLVTAGSGGQAVELFTELLHRFPQNSAAHFGLGEAELARDNVRAAEAAFERAVRLDPANQAARARTALCARILSLDPTPAGLRPASRYERSRTLLDAVLAAADSCRPGPTDATLAAARDQGRRLLAVTHRPRLLAEAVEANLEQVRGLWALIPTGCRPAADDAVSRVMARLDR